MRNNNGEVGEPAGTVLITSPPFTSFPRKSKAIYTGLPGFPTYDGTSTLRKTRKMLLIVLDCLFWNDLRTTVLSGCERPGRPLQNPAKG